MTETKTCLNCDHAEIIGRDIPGNLIDPPESAEAECNYDGEGQIEKYFELLDLLIHHEIDFFNKKINSKAKFCPFFIKT